jgi:mono/diheme cytochrome c family protein
MNVDFTMCIFPLVNKWDIAARSALLVIVLTAVPAAADEPPAFTPFSPASASKPGPFIHSDGATLYRAICQGCHMPDARGARGAGEYPALAANTRLASAAFPVARVLNGWLGMPRFAQMLSDAQIAEVVNYVRTNFDNHYTDRLTTDDVERMRATMKTGGDK